MNVKLFAPAVARVTSTSANRPAALDGNSKRKACCNSAISRWFGPHVAACQQKAAKSPLKGSLSKGAYLNVLVFLCSSTFHHMYTEAGPWSHTSSLLCICLAAFAALAPSFPLSSLFHLGFDPLLLCYPTFLLCLITGLSSPMKTPPVLDNFKMTRWLLKCYD